MTVPELAARIEQRLAELQQEIVRLKATDDALAAARTNAVAAEPALAPHAPRRPQELPLFDQPSRPVSSDWYS